MRLLLSDPSGYLCKELAKIFSGEDSGNELLQTPWDNLDELTAIVKEQADLIILDLARNVAQSNTILNILNAGDWTEPKTLIGVSSIMTWNETKAKKDKLLTESEYKNRKCTPRFKELKMLETLVLSAKKDGLLTSLVVAPGIMYGAGEDSLVGLFRDAWMCEQEALKVIGDGSNPIPVIHVQDCAKFIEKLSSAPPEDKAYFVAVDNSELTQQKLVETVSKGIGTGKVEAAAADDEALLLEDSQSAQLLTCSLKFDKETMHLSSTGLEWTSENFGAGFERVRTEFVTTRGLQPVRICVVGAPGAGKTFYSEKLSAKYYIPHIKLGDVVNEVMAAGGELADKANALLADPGEKLSAKGKKPAKKAPPKGGKGGKGKKTDDRPRLPAKMLAQMLHQKLQSAPCRNKGYVLDGFPRTAEEASALFEIKEEKEGEEPPPEPAEGEVVEEQPVVYNTAVMASFVVSIETSKEDALARFLSLPQDQLQEDHNDDEGFQRRWANHEFTVESVGEPSGSSLTFFKSLEVLEVPGDIASNADTGMSAACRYIEANGTPFNFHPTPKELAERKEAAEKAAHEEAVAAAALAAEREASERTAKEERQREEAARKASVLREDSELVEAASLPLRKYLMANVIPDLVDGLLDVCKTQPDDPIDYLAEYLFKVANTPEVAQ